MMSPTTSSTGLTGVWLALLLALGAAGGGVHAGLPAQLGGEALPSLAPMLERVTPAVVNISTTSLVPERENSLLNDPFFRRFFDLPSRPKKRRAQSLGSGVIVDAVEGYVLTNFHVIEDAQQIAVTLRDGRRVSAQLIGHDEFFSITMGKD